MNRKQEKIARRWAVERLMTPDMLIEAWLSGCSSRYEVADYLNITEDFLMETIGVFKRTYGAYYIGNRHTLFFHRFRLLCKIKKPPQYRKYWGGYVRNQRQRTKTLNHIIALC